jgi:hypothetical protein
MFIATAITNQTKLRRSETRSAIYIALLRSCELKQTGIYKHFGIYMSTGLAPSSFATQRSQTLGRESRN